MTAGNAGEDDLAEMELVPLDERRAYVGQTPAREEARADAELWQVTAADVRVHVGVIAWSNGERSVMLLDRLDSPESLDRLAHGLAISIYNHPSDSSLSYMELRQARFRTPDHGPRDIGAYKADLHELSDGAGLPVRRTLIDLGARDVGTRERLLGDDSRRRGDKAVVFPADLVAVSVGGLHHRAHPPDSPRSHPLTGNQRSVPRARLGGRR